MDKDAPDRDSTIKGIENRLDDEIKRSYPNGCFVVYCFPLAADFS